MRSVAVVFPASMWAAMPMLRMRRSASLAELEAGGGGKPAANPRVGAKGAEGLEAGPAARTRGARSGTSMLMRRRMVTMHTVCAG
jgi:hypothetical protein